MRLHVCRPKLPWSVGTTNWLIRPCSKSSRPTSCQGAHVGSQRLLGLVAARPAKVQTTPMVSTPISATEEYGADQIQVLQGLEPVRKRPGMYIGSTGQRGLHHLVYEVLDNGIDEVQAGHATVIEIDIHLDSGWVTITDNGRGIPTALHPATGKSSLETVLTVLHAGGKFGGDASGYKVSGGLHGVGISVVNALSSKLEVCVWRGGMQYTQHYSRGVPVTGLLEAPHPTDQHPRQGTQVRFLFDDQIFSNSATFDSDTLRSRVRELAFLNRAATIRFRACHPSHSSKSTSSSICKIGGAANGTAPSSNGYSTAVEISHHVDGRAADGTSTTSAPDDLSSDAEAADRDGWQTFHYEGGLREFVTWLNKGKEVMHAPIHFSKRLSGVLVEGALQWCSDAYSDTVLGFANSIRTVDGGTHIEGMRAALTRTINTLARHTKLLKEGEDNLIGDHVREGLGAILSVKVPDPEFEGQTKTRLGNPEVRRIVDNCVTEAVTEWMENHPAALSAVVAKAVTAARASDAAKRARDLIRQKNVLTRSTLPGKLADCAPGTSCAEREIFLVEGDSAGGSAKQARDRRTQAVLPLRGKILNIERDRDEASMYKNSEISNLIIALGLTHSRAATSTTSASGSALDSLRYGRIVILTDADVDGAHIRTLLLTFLFRFQQELFQKGHVYAAVPPLFKLDAPRRPSRYLYSEGELREALKELSTVHGVAADACAIQRFKGLGEMMPEQLWQTTLNPASRLLRRLTIDDAAASSQIFSLLMGSNVAPRRALIQAQGHKYTADLDI